ncbi:polyprenyl synthetase family protein [Legionella sp. km772]|nr:polyprenyl synthetase family protein [Legionella sp. km772]
MIDAYLQRHEHYLAQLIKERSIPAPVISSALNYALFPGGKRIRPLLVYLAGHLLNVDLKALDVIAAAIELTHCYSLVHDDLPAMDDDDFRRGRPSCHKHYDEATAILVGDGMQALAIEILLSGLSPLLAAKQVIKITQELVLASGISGMVSGQSLDLSELSKGGLTEQELQTIHQLKTGKLISACFAMVLASQEEVGSHLASALTHYANHIGLVFQIQDDYLDYYAPQNHLGKNRSSDLANQKTTFASLFTQSQLEEKINHHYEQALSCLQPFAEKALPLIELTTQLRQRSQLK